MKTASLVTPAILVGVMCAGVAAQTPPAPQPAPKPAVQPRKAATTQRPTRVVVENSPSVPQVVTILHRLNGLKVFRLLLRSEQLGAIARLDEDFKIAGEVHTNVIAGLALDDGRTIAAWLPEVGAEMPPPVIHGVPRTPILPRKAPKETEVTGPVPSTIVGVPAEPLAGSLLEPANLKVITRDGKRVLGRYVGLDGLTGLSVITLANGSFPKTVDSEEDDVAVGQRVKLVGPEPAPKSETNTRNSTYVRIGERDAIVVNVKRSPTGHLSRVKVKSSKLSPVNIGGVAINAAGETLGIVDAVVGTEATIVPVGLIKSAAKRVIERQASVPRPWLGVRGEPVEATSLEQILRHGWQLERARLLAEKKRGILLTAVVAGSPAARAKLKAGDIILNVNNGDIKSGEDFTWVLQEAEPGESLSFTVARPGKIDYQAFTVELGESPDPLFGWRKLENALPKWVPPGSLMAHGVETVPIKHRVASRLGATSGLLVVYVQPETAAFKAGLRPGDVIESIDGQQVVSGYAPMAYMANPAAGYMLNVVRNKEKIVLTIETTLKKSE